MRKSLPALTLSLFVLPVIVAALDFTDRADDYSDAPFTKAEAVAISVLTNLKAVQGNPDGSFQPRRALNRAEFTKIALLSSGLQPGDAEDCFPDVREKDWFSVYVCRAKKDGIVSGNPDGTFHPERLVNYAEAVKILGGIYEYELKKQRDDEWFMPYVRAAGAHRTALPTSVEPGDVITRGEMARLAAAFRAEADGELDLYRAAEQGKALSSASSFTSSVSSTPAGSSSSTSSSVSSNPSSSSAISSSSSAAANLPDFPSKSHLLMFGELSQPIAGGKFFADKEGLFVQGTEVIMREEAKSLDTLFMIDEFGKRIGQLYLDPLDSNKKKWVGTFYSSGSYHIPKATERVLGIQARLKARDNGGVPGELVEIKTFRVTSLGEDSGATYNAFAPDAFFPKNRAVQGKIVSVKNALAEKDTFILGQNQLIAAFTVTSASIPPTKVLIKRFSFNVSKSSGVSVINWQLGMVDSPVRTSCSVGDSLINCLGIMEEMGTVAGGSRTYRLFGDVTLDQGVKDPFLQVSLNDPGTVTTQGDIEWTDEAATFSWIEVPMPIMRATLWK
ncbi:MAG: hypothetical protein Greene041619_487 [Candidatus Peregrinibacteria bacterium Greene0416_19]|nr:MAG: hypothetical protein Greene041619_487 [Candidatus Peregrinibacteria bacterium Greene0416_19]